MSMPALRVRYTSATLLVGRALARVTLRFDIFAMLVLTAHLAIRLLQHLLRGAEKPRFIVGLLANLFDLLPEALADATQPASHL